jgi:hypothetical protein
MKWTLLVRISTALTLAFLPISLSLPSVEASQQVQKKSLETHIQEVTGRQSVVNCGEYDKSASPSEEALRKSLACAEDSVKQHKPSRMVVHRVGADSFVAYGVLSDATGRAFLFNYDSAPCGGPNCAERFLKKTCRVSDVKVLADGGYYRLVLKQ